MAKNDYSLLIGLIILIIIIILIVWAVSGSNNCNNVNNVVNDTINDKILTKTTKSPQIVTICKKCIDPQDKSKKFKIGNEVVEKRKVSETLPTFLRPVDPNAPERIIVSASSKSNRTLPKEFDARKQWPGLITGVMDQGECGSCWSFSASGVFGDRIRIKNGPLAADDHISHYNLAACMKCSDDGKVCNTVCDGHYMDEVLEYLKTHGAYSFKDLSKITKNANDYICVKPSRESNIKNYKSNGVYRANIHTLKELNTTEKKFKNEQAIMHDIMDHGPVTATIKVFDPTKKAEIKQNFYLYKKGIFGHNWKKDPSSSDGYHAIAIIGWGEEVIEGEIVKYWIIRNSWGKDWGQEGFGKVLRGDNRAIIESDIWCPRVDASRL